MRLRQELNLEQTWLPAVRIEATKEQPKVTLYFRTNLSPDVAEAFGCRELIYAGDVPRAGVESMKLEGEERDCEVHLEQEKVSMRLVATSLSNFSVTMDGEGPKLKFQVHLQGYEGAAADLIRDLKIDPVKLVLKPSQMQLDLKAEGDTAEAAETEDPEDAKKTAADEDFMQEMGIGDKEKVDGSE